MSSVRFEETESGPALVSGGLRLAVDRERGTFALTDTAPGGAALVDAATAVALGDGRTFTSSGARFVAEPAAPVQDAHGSGLSLRLRSAGADGDPGLTLTVTLYEDQPFAVLQTEIENTTGEALKVASFRVVDGARVDLGSPAAGWKMYTEGWQNWSPAMVLPVSGEDIYMAPPVIGPITGPPAAAGRFLSEMMTAIVDPASGVALVAGFVSTADQFSQVWLDREPAAVTAASYADGISLPPGATLSSERLLLEPSREPLASLQRYGDALAREMRAVPWPQPVSGWCSWYYYWQGVTEEHILANLASLRWSREQLPVAYVQIDDGYQAGIGDWLTPNQKFPRGLGWLAGRIHDSGYRAGLWLAPFMIGEKSQLWKDHPDWAVQYKPGRPYIAMINWDQYCYAMDVTRPDVLEWLEKLFRTVFEDWRFDYIKIDFLYAAAVDGIRHDPDVTRAQAYRRAIQLIRRLAGDRFILGCGHPIGPSIGLMNGARIGPDVAPFWYPAERPREPGRSDLSTVSTLNGIRNVASRFWMHNRLWLNDPDCMLARDSDTAMTADEVRTLATVIALSGGMTLDSDNLMRLSPQRLELLSMLLPVYGRSGVPVDLFQSDLPQLIELDCGTHRLLGIFNWADAPAEVRAPLPPTDQHAFEAWSQDYLGVVRDSITVTLPAHACKLLALRPALSEPQLVGTSFHLLQGALEAGAQHWDGTALHLLLRPVAKREGEVFIRADAEPRAEGAAVRRAGDGVWALRLRIEAEMELRITFGAPP